MSIVYVWTDNLIFTLFSEQNNLSSGRIPSRSNLINLIFRPARLVCPVGTTEKDENQCG